VPISVPGMGKTFFYEKVLVPYCQQRNIPLNVVHSDEVRKTCMDRLAERQKKLSKDQLFEMTGKDANKMFMDKVEAKLRFNTKAGSILYVDKNHPPNGIEKIVSHIRSKVPPGYKAEILALAPNMDSEEVFSINDMDGNSVSWPFSLNFFLKCLERVQKRKNHET